MIHRALVSAALICCGLVLASFVMFTRDQLAGAAKQQANAVTATAPAQPATPAKHATEGQPGRFIRGAAADLTSPFASIVHSSNDWVRHILPTAFALLVYGLGLGYLARYSRGFA